MAQYRRDTNQFIASSNTIFEVVMVAGPDGKPGGSTPSLSIPAGNVTGSSGVNKFGQNPLVATESTEGIWDVSTPFNLPANTDITHISQDADQATMRGATIEIQGCGDNFVSVTQTANLDASDTSTPIAINTPLRRVYRMKVLDSTITTEDIIISDSNANTIYGQITKGNNQTLMAVYTVAANNTAYITNYYASLNKQSGGGDPDIIVRMWHQDNENGYAPMLKHVLGLESGGSTYFQHKFDPYYRVPEKTDIYLDVTNLSTSATADVSGGFDLIVVSNT